MPMLDLLTAPGAPYALVSVAGGMLVFLGMLLMNRQRSLVAGMPMAPSTVGMSGRYLAGQFTGIPVAAVLVLVVLVGNVQGDTRLLLLVSALAAYLYLGVVIPRRPLVQRQREAAALRTLTPGFISFVRVSLGSFEAPIEVLRRYIVRPRPQWAVMQATVADALRVSEQHRLRPFEALATVVRERDCRELSDVCAALAQAEAEGGRIDTVLAAQQATLEIILQSEFKRMLRRRTMYLLLMVAVSLVVGILMNLLFVMTKGGSIFGAL